MKTIDADAHIVEGEQTWEFLKASESRFRPMLTDIPITHQAGHLPARDSGTQKYWVTGGFLKYYPADSTIADGIRNLTDIPARLSKMDEMGIDIQVVYPTFFVVRPVDQPEGMLALARSYNRFMAEACGKSNGRLRWIVVPAVDRMAETLEEVEFGKEHGACGVLLNGIEGERLLSDPYFFPLYEKVSALDLPICTHTGHGNRLVHDMFAGTAFYNTRAPVLCAFHDLVLAGVPDRFPKLRCGFIEAGGEWVPYIIGELSRRGKWLKHAKSDEGSLMRDKRLFVSCRADDDLAYLQNWTGKRNIVTGTDYGHDDYSKEVSAFHDLRGAKYDNEMVDGILSNNPAELYAIQA